jgi:hypothetical protein
MSLVVAGHRLAYIGGSDVDVVWQVVQVVLHVVHGCGSGCGS